MSTKLEEAVVEWVRAEYQFRLGRQAYRTEPTNWYLKAERKLRRALTGFGDLADAYGALMEKKNGETSTGPDS